MAYPCMYGRKDECDGCSACWQGTFMGRGRRDPFASEPEENLFEPDEEEET